MPVRAPDCRPLRMGMVEAAYDCVLAIGAEDVRQRPCKMMMFLPGTMSRWSRPSGSSRRRNGYGRKRRPGKASGPCSAGRTPAFMDLTPSAETVHGSHGTTQRQLAVIAAKAHNNSIHNFSPVHFPHDGRRGPRRQGGGHPRRGRCGPGRTGSGGRFCSERFREVSEGCTDRASVLRSQERRRERHCARHGSRLRWQASPSDIDVVEVHATVSASSTRPSRWDSAPSAKEALAESGATAIGGDPGQSGAGPARPPVGARACQVYELAAQLRGEAEKADPEGEDRPRRTAEVPARERLPWPSIFSKGVKEVGMIEPMQTDNWRGCKGVHGDRKGDLQPQEREAQERAGPRVHDRRILEAAGSHFGGQCPALEVHRAARPEIIGGITDTVVGTQDVRATCSTTGARGFRLAPGKLKIRLSNEPIPCRLPP